MFPLIFQSLCAHKICFVPHLTITSLNLECVQNMCKKHFEEEIYVRSKFLVCASLTTCVRNRGNIAQHVCLNKRNNKRSTEKPENFITSCSTIVHITNCQFL